jgi:hypothetical protein
LNNPIASERTYIDNLPKYLAFITVFCQTRGKKSLQKYASVAVVIIGKEKSRKRKVEREK